ncbi:1-deoxy-D-xylulose-5-phosphate reductoisomerase [Sedimenticola thiotaurini]|uniref:1-deoxy-D-xylulose 5-phosphate reductoisomerase n=1 Tax=Sedimenticola thiotaurini TaxID=1543721 RepID=A0A0F7JUP3_9GAMM|nr:1-deoxy-D-xylulose-5-phosphate reductoisomerase [Sedimenticola thiotaurini]AKH19307.1 1-deoxy-D-xylulose 5-phosphate reductoisomerase [Sedimenticola thiotaurini]
MIGLTVLGSTGSIGISTLDVVARHPDSYRVVALTANRDVERLYQQCLKFQPRYAVMADADAALALEKRLRDGGESIRVLAGMDGLEHVASMDEAHYVMAAIVGAAGLLPTLAAARAGKRVLLANKEALVVSGALFMQAVEQGGAEILPIDSEHNAVFQCMPADFSRGLDQVGVSRILLTASGGPFRSLPLDQLRDVTPDQACAHPNWDMGRKISVDSATMMNKGLEVIEACWLFHTSPERIQVVLHPQSVIHSMVAYTDGSVLAQLGNPDMRTPIAHALAWPKRIDSGVAPLDLFEVARLDFTEPSFERFACLRLAYGAIETGGTCPAILNAANEVAVAAFLSQRLGFIQIPEVIESVLEALPVQQDADLDTLLAVDEAARRQAEQIIRSRV